MLNSDAGFLPELENRNIIGLFPQIKKSKNNPYGCWDYWGYLDPDDLYYTNQGIQVKALRHLIYDISGK